MNPFRRNFAEGIDSQALAGTDATLCCFHKVSAGSEFRELRGPEEAEAPVCEYPLKGLEYPQIPFERNYATAPCTEQLYTLQCPLVLRVGQEK